MHIKLPIGAKFTGFCPQNDKSSTAAPCMQSTQFAYGAFKSCRIHRIYELNAHERHHKVVITSGNLEIFFKPRVSELGACQ